MLLSFRLYKDFFYYTLYTNPSYIDYTNRFDLVYGTLVNARGFFSVIISYFERLYYLIIIL